MKRNFFKSIDNFLSWVYNAVEIRFAELQILRFISKKLLTNTQLSIIIELSERRKRFLILCGVRFLREGLFTFHNILWQGAELQILRLSFRGCRQSRFRENGTLCRSFFCGVFSFGQLLYILQQKNGKGREKTAFLLKNEFFFVKPLYKRKKICYNTRR